MANQVEFDNTISEWVGGIASAEASGATVQEALYQVSMSYPALRLFNCEGELRSIVRVARNNAPASLNEPLAPGDTLKLSVGV